MRKIFESAQCHYKIPRKLGQRETRQETWRRDSMERLADLQDWFQEVILVYDTALFCGLRKLYFIKYHRSRCRAASASYFWKLNTFLNFTINAWDLIVAWRLINLQICVTTGLQKHISDQCNLHVYLCIYSRQYNICYISCVVGRPS